MSGNINKKSSALSLLTKIESLFFKMLNNDIKILSLLLKIVPVVTVINAVMLFFNIPFAIIPFSLVSCSRIMLGIMFGNSVYSLAIVPLACISVFISGVSIKKGKLIFPIFAFCYFIYELAITLFCTVTDLYDFSVGAVMAVAALIDALIVFLLGRYLIKEFKKRKQAKTEKTSDI